NVDASKIIFSHTDIYKGRIANLVWELIALPRPQFAKIELPDYTLSSSKSHYYLGDSNFYELMAQDNREAMKEINQFRQMGDAGKKIVNELSLLAFGADEELKKEDWAAAEQKIREISKLHYLYPGWRAQFTFGLVHKGFFIDSTGVQTDWQYLDKDFIHLLLAFVLLKQGKCDEAVQEIDQLRSSSRAFQAREKLGLKALGSYKIRWMNCHAQTLQKQ
ncbi:MAG: hypothetical protein ACREEM_35910, partial [Blastocatellia bacterium]